jgi:hypothetical protein
MGKIHVERLGGIGGFGGAHSHIRSEGEIDLATLGMADLQSVERLFDSKRQRLSSQTRDAFRYRIRRTTPEGVETVELSESDVPAVVSQCVKDELV